MINNRGLSLIEVIVAVAVVGIVSTTAFLGNDFLTKHQIRSASREFYARLQALRQAAMTKGTANTSIGHGLRFTSNSSYTIFEFLDVDNDYAYDGVAEEAGSSASDLPAGMTVKIKPAVDPTTRPLFYDKRGLSRDENWSAVSGRTYIFAHPKADTPTCVTVSTVRIREGLWDEGEVPPKCIIQ